MWIISPKSLKEFYAKHVAATRPLEAWLRVAKRAKWKNLSEVRLDYPHADAVSVSSGRVVTVFNVGGNKFRLVTAIHYNTQAIFVLRVLTHGDYDRDSWKEQL